VMGPSEDELVAIVIAIEEAWPRHVVVTAQADTASAWRFSGRWWSRPVAVRRERPWLR
jgi:hypothetical protein